MSLAKQPVSEAARPAATESNEGIFTRYLRLLDAGGEPPAETFDTLWRALGGAVVVELRRRSVWTSPPSYMGIYGWESWQTWDPGPGRTASALEELLVDCYSFVFLEQRPRLRAQLAIKDNVDGLVILYLRNYLHDRRKHHDLLGFRIFESVRRAVRLAVEAGQLRVVSGNPKILNGTLLAATSVGKTAWETIEQCQTLEQCLTVGKCQTVEQRRDTAEKFAEAVASWKQDLLPDLVTASGASRSQVVDRLRLGLLSLGSWGLDPFRLKDVVDPLKRDVRARWAAIFDLEEGETGLEDDPQGFATVVRLARGENGGQQHGVETRDNFNKLVACVANLIEGRDQPEQVRHYLRTLWGFLRAWASGSGQPCREALPSGRSLGELLGIPRKRLPRLWTTLRELVECCQLSLTGSNLEKEKLP